MILQIALGIVLAVFILKAISHVHANRENIFWGAASFLAQGATLAVVILLFSAKYWFPNY